MKRTPLCRNARRACHRATRLIVSDSKHLACRTTLRLLPTLPVGVLAFGFAAALERGRAPVGRAMADRNHADRRDLGWDAQQRAQRVEVVGAGEPGVEP